MIDSQAGGKDGRRHSSLRARARVFGATILLLTAPSSHAVADFYCDVARSGAVERRVAIESSYILIAPRDGTRYLTLYVQLPGLGGAKAEFGMPGFDPQKILTAKNYADLRTNSLLSIQRNGKQMEPLIGRHQVDPSRYPGSWIAYENCLNCGWVMLLPKGREADHFLECPSLSVPEKYDRRFSCTVYENVHEIGVSFSVPKVALQHLDDFRRDVKTFVGNLIARGSEVCRPTKREM
ncbi:hypothetical protein [Dongia mobilis]|uniref:hypothetical protein n=1 Tax=Dongia sp. TaxID=1977262 RepID=UPI0026EDF8C7